MKINWLKKCFFRNKYNFERVSKELDKEKFINNYPEIDHCLYDQIQAYNALFLVDTSYTQEIVELINRHSTMSYELKRDKKYQDLSNEKTFVKVNIFSDFNGDIIHLITDNENLISDLLIHHHQPPSPEISFPEVYPLGLGSLQGNIDFWLNSLWMPFYLSLSEDERNKLQLPPDWFEYLEEIRSGI